MTIPCHSWPGAGAAFGGPARLRVAHWVPVWVGVTADDRAVHRNFFAEVGQIGTYSVRGGGDCNLH